MNKAIKGVFRVCCFSLLIALGLAMTGCSISTRESNGHNSAGDSSSDKNKDVDIRTPFGSLSVHQGSMEAKDTGLSAYPGSQLTKSRDHDGDSSANVNISSSLFGMKLIVLKYESKDSPDKVLGFYRKEMGKYGKVVDCKGSFNMNFHPREKNDNEVTCDREDHGGGDYKQELKVGTENNQRIVAIKPVGEGSEFALVYVRAHGDKDTM
jgi:hypothetical protein